MSRAAPGIAVTRPRPGVCLITFDRPEVRNALDAEGFRQLASALTAAEGDPAVGAVVLTGAPGAFCSGADLRSLGTNGPPASEGPSAAEVMERFPKPVLAAVNGVAVGFGFTMLLLCDLVLVARGARMSAPFLRLGIVPDAASSVLLPERLGWQRAAELLYAGTWLEADEAVVAGLALSIEDESVLLDATLDRAETIAAMPRQAVGETKRLLLARRRDACRRARDDEKVAFDRLLAARAADGSPG